MLNRKRVLTIGFVVLCTMLPMFILGQVNEDKGGEYFVKTWKVLSQRKTELGQSLADSSRAFYLEDDNEYGVARHNFLLGAIAKIEGDFFRADSLFTVFLTAATEKRDSSDLASVHFQLGIVNEALGKLDKAIDMQFKSIDYYSLSGDSTSTNSGLNNIGSLYRKLKQYDQSEEYFFKALKINERINDLDGQATNHVNLGNLYAEQNYFDKAITRYKQAVYLDSLTNFQWGLAYDYENIGNMYVKQKKYALAEEPLLKALDIREVIKGKYELALSNLKLGGLYTQLQQYQKANQFLTTAENFGEETGALETQRDILRAWSELKEKEGSPVAALDYYKQYDKLADSILNTNTTNEIARLNVTFESERKERKIELLGVKNQLSEGRLKNSKTTNLILGLFLSLFGIMGAMLWRLYKGSIKKNEIISKALSEKEILLKEIHHRVKNNLQFVSSLLGLQTEHVEDEAALGALQEGQDRVQSMALIHQNLYQDENLTGVSVKDYFIKLIQGLFDSYNIKNEQIQLDLDIEDLNLDVDTVIPIGLILNELITNCLKYAFPNEKSGRIAISLIEQNDALQLKVMDNGVGLLKDKKEALGSSFGYRLIEAFTSQLRGKLTVDGNSGTSVVLSIHKYQKV